MKENIQYKVISPRLINQKHKNQVYELIKNGSQIIDFSIDKFYDCPLSIIAVDNNSDKVIGIRLIKKVYDRQIEYYKEIINFDITNHFELGYLVVHSNYRKKGIASKMLEILLNNLDVNTKLFTTTRVGNISEKILLKFDFKLKNSLKSKYSNNMLNVFEYIKKS